MKRAADEAVTKESPSQEWSTTRATIVRCPHTSGPRRHFPTQWLI
ncbi:MAG: hypothetical protein ACE5OZ_18215 [Candidatus Heimdallarchaeota archaeon]